MIKKILCLMTALVLVSACDTTSDAGGDGSLGNKLTQAFGHGTKFENANIADRVFFDYDKSSLGDEARATLDSQAAMLKKTPAIKSILVEGHADERGTREYNLALGERRANAVKNYLVADGVKAARIKTVSYGKERPAVEGSDEAAWAQNRRSVSIISDKAFPVAKPAKPKK